MFDGRIVPRFYEPFVSCGEDIDDLPFPSWLATLAWTCTLCVIVGLGCFTLP